MAEFLAMGGYAAFVWPAYALTAATLAAIAFASWRELRALERELADFEGGK
ncbi:MAG: heme exporter protein CcmD [Rhodospirillales bacterium]|nr:heme exporter protein CcmD [Rhodospirillales bacterium]